MCVRSLPTYLCGASLALSGRRPSSLFPEPLLSPFSSPRESFHPATVLGIGRVDPRPPRIFVDAVTLAIAHHLCLASVTVRWVALNQQSQCTCLRPLPLPQTSALARNNQPRTPRTCFHAYLRTQTHAWAHRWSTCAFERSFDRIRGLVQRKLLPSATETCVQSTPGPPIVAV